MTAPDARQRCRGSCLSAAGCAGPLNTALGTSLGTPILDREVAVLVVPPEFARPVCLGVPTYGDNDAFEQNAGRYRPAPPPIPDSAWPSVESPNARFLVGCAVPLDAEPYQRAAAD
jgi:hypothetical protein